MVNVAPSVEKQPSKNEDKTLSQGYRSVATATSNSRKPTCRMEVTVRVKMPAKLKVSFFTFAKSKGHDASSLLRDFAAECVSERMGLRSDKIRDLTLPRIERKFDYLLAVSQASDATAFQKEIAKELSAELHQDLSSYLLGKLRRKKDNEPKL